MKKLLTLNQLKSGRRVVCYLLTVMLTLALTLLPQSAWAQEGIEYYGITVGGVEVTSWTVEYGITGENIEGMVTYDSQSNTLTLNGATIKNYSGITCMNDLTILCLGESVVTGDIKSTSTNGATLTLQYGDVDIAASLLYRPDIGEMHQALPLWCMTACISRQEPIMPKLNSQAATRVAYATVLPVSASRTNTVITNRQCISPTPRATTSGWVLPR